MSETTMRRDVVRLLSRLDAFAVENRAWPGTPDVNYQEGWIELKQAGRWPPKGGDLKLEHFTKQQRYFLRERWGNGGNVFLLLKVGRDWLLFDGDVAARDVGRATKEQLFGVARAYWVGKPRAKELIACLSR